MEYEDRIQALRTRVSEVKDALNTFKRRAEGDEKADALRRAGFGSRLISGLRVRSMIRYTDERDFLVLYQKVDGMLEELNSLEAEIEDETQTAYADGREDAAEEDEE